MVAALQRAVAVARDEGDRRDAGPLDDLGDDVGRRRGQPPQPALLPRRDEPREPRRRTRALPARREREPSAGALAAARDGP